MKVLRVDLGERSYPISIGTGLLGNSGLLKPAIKGEHVLIVSNETIAPLYLEELKKGLGEYRLSTIVLPDGEKYKQLDILNRIYDILLADKHNRSTTLIALGGGVIGDMTGFAAATYQRGVNFIQVPTTLLAQVDSSVGGKTGVNHPLGKNMIGAFHQPLSVIIDTGVLQTLPDRELSAGLAEVIKYGLIADADFFSWLENSIESLLARNPDSLAEAIERSCANKALVVAEDEKEAGRRAILNLGHTFGHAIETEQGYGQWLHGEAVAAGMVMALTLSAKLGWIADSVIERAGALLKRAGLPVVGPKGMLPETYIDHMAVDKKVIDGDLRLVLLRGLGEAVVTSDFPMELLLETLEICREK
jgi:3-dehydroquinate synthase